MMADPPQTFKNCISNRDDECLIYGADNLSQFTQPIGNLPSKCDRALPAARSKDIVILRGKLNLEYQSWLASLGLGTDHIVSYGRAEGKTMLSRMIADNPVPIQKIIKKINKKPVYVPWFSGDMENKVAKVLGADLFGAPSALTWKYNDKSIFKTSCRQLGIPVVEDTLFSIHPKNHKNRHEMESIIRQYLSKHPEVLIRGTMDNTGISLVFKTKGDDINALYHKLSKNQIGQILIEPLLPVIASPNDQWIVTRDKKIRHVGLQDQVLKDLRHIGTLKITEQFPLETAYILDTSFKIVQQMMASGYTGVIGIDYIVTGSKIYPVEINARFNGSSYVKIIINNIEDLTGPVPCWKYMKAKTRPCSFNALAKQIKPLLFDGFKSESIFPYNCDNLDKTGDFAVILLAYDPERIAALEQTLNGMGVG